MKDERKIMLRFAILVIAICLAGVSYGDPMGTVFTYQGRLVDVNSPADGLYDFEFELYDDADADSQQGSTVDVNDLDVTDGYFTVGLDFGTDIFTGDARWLEIAVRPGDSSDPCDFDTLSPRQELTATPHALYSNETRGIFVSERVYDDNTWTAWESNRKWNRVAMSSDGTKQTALVYTGQIYVSTDSGNTWTPKESNRYWYSVAMSADGTKQTAVVYGGQIYVSTDSGNTWTPKESNREWGSVAMSEDGTIQTALERYIYVSTDSGNTWTPKGLLRLWYSVAMSADGSIQTVVDKNGPIYVSTDYGNTWTPKDSDRGWHSVAMSANGSIQTAVVQNGQIYVSTDSGNTWTPKDSNRNWYWVAMSADGTKQTAVVYNGQIYINLCEGKVGIGTTSPTETLEVTGMVKATGFAGNGSSLTNLPETDPTVPASVKDGVAWYEVTSKPSGFADDIDDVGLTSETDPTVLASVKDGVSWGELSAIPAGFADDVDDVGTDADWTINGIDIYTGAVVTGNVGIGTTSPQNKLDVEGAVAVGASYSGTNTGPANGMIIEGDVGIGTNSPTEALDVNGTVNATAFIGDGSGLTNIAGIETDPTVDPNVKDGVSWSEVSDIPSGFADGNDNVVDDDWVEAGGNIYRETGNVGIGTTSPSAKLDVNGTVKANSFNGVPWRSPCWFVTNVSDSADIGWLNEGTGWKMREFHLPFNVTIEGFIVSGDDEANGSAVRLQLYVNGSSSSAGNSTSLSDWNSVRMPFPSAINVSANSDIEVKGLAGNNAVDIACWLYGRYNE